MSTLQIAEIQEIQGAAFAVDSEGNRRQLKAGDVLFEGETVETSDGGVVSMLLADGQPFVISGQPVFLISADLVADLAPNAAESALQAETLDELLAEGELESLEDIIDSGEASPDSLDDLLAAAEDDPTASGIDFDNLAATAAGGDSGGDDAGGSSIVQASRIDTSGDPTTSTGTESNTTAAVETNTLAGETNNLPEANADAIVAQEDVLLENINVLTNDVDADGDPLTISSATSQQGGTVSINPDGTLNYQAPANFSGEDTITYSVTDAAGGTSSATVTVTVEPVNDAPVASDDAIIAQEDVLLESINVLGNDNDVDGEALSVIEAASEQGGTVSI